MCSHLKWLVAVCCLASLLILPDIAESRSQWKKGALIGAGIGAGGGAVVSGVSCTKSENWHTGACLALTMPVDMAVGGLVGFGVGALVGGFIKQDEAESPKGGSYAFRGLLIGAGAGLVVGGGIALAVSREDCSLSSDPGDCGAIKGITTVAALTGLPVFGGLLGLGIGAVIPRRQDQVFIPMISPNGGGMRLAFQF